MIKGVFISIDSHRALILPGAVAKGAYEAGVIDTIIKKDIRVDRIIATSSGALNGVAYAAGIRAGQEKKMAERLVHSWIEHGSWHDSLSFNPLSWLKGAGLSDRTELMKMLHSLVTPCRSQEKHDIELRIIVAPLNGVRGKIGERDATTYEKVLHFSGKDFDTAEGLERIFEATTAACAFPGLFSPVEIEGLGPCADGGAVNNAPIKYALSDAVVDDIIIVVPFPAVMSQPESLQGLKLINHMVEILINERLYRDLKEAEVVNNEVRKLDKLVTSGIIDAAQLTAVKELLGIRPVQITQVRPSEPFKNSAFSGFFSKTDRTQLVEAGRKAALECLS